MADLPAPLQQSPAPEREDAFHTETKTGAGYEKNERVPGYSRQTLMLPTMEFPDLAVARFETLARPLLRGPGEWATKRYGFGGLEVWARTLPSTRPGSLYLYWVGVRRPGQGEGARGMRLLADIADKAGLALQLHADPWGANPMTRDALRAWYERFGFVARSGTLVPYWPGRLGLAMWRKPANHTLDSSLDREPTPSLNRTFLHKAIRLKQEHGLLPRDW